MLLMLRVPALTPVHIGAVVDVRLVYLRVLGLFRRSQGLLAYELLVEVCRSFLSFLVSVVYRLGDLVLVVSRFLYYLGLGFFFLV